MVDTHLAFRNLGDLQFENVSAEWGLDAKGVSFGAAFGDLGGDGNLDLVYTNYEGGVTILRNDNDTGHRVNVDLRGTVSNRFGVGATVRIESALGSRSASSRWRGGTCRAASRCCTSASAPTRSSGDGRDLAERPRADV
jgi:hypothetical protein